jgi:hypothetical protein
MYLGYTDRVQAAFNTKILIFESVLLIVLGDFKTGQVSY